MRVIDKLSYFFSIIHLRIVYKKLENLFRIKAKGRKHIRLAMVGTAASGKGFLLQDILTSLKFMGFIFKPQENSLENPRDFNVYSPCKTGENDTASLRACRRSDVHGATISKNTPSHDDYDMDFLSIPGEIFSVHGSEPSHLSAYACLCAMLKKAGHFFTVTLWKSDSDSLEWIVEPVTGWTNDECDLENLLSINPVDSSLGYKTWSRIFTDLEMSGYRPVKGSSRRISGATLLKHFFEYDTDSAIRSIQEWIRANTPNELGFGADEFETREHDKCFVYFHYCAMATDFVVCDRIFTKDKAPKEMTFGEITSALESHIGSAKNGERQHVYLAFRNADFMMRSHESNYKTLNERTLAELTPENRRNAIYSLFAYSILHYLNPRVKKLIADLSQFIGVPSIKIDADARTAINDYAFTSNTEELAMALLDVNPVEGTLKDGTPNLRAHILSRLGDCGHAFRMLLMKTRFGKGQNDTPTWKIVPHVYFTSTPITGEYDIYEKSSNPKGPAAHDFEKVINGKKYLFSDQNSNACFGSYQLTMDILTQHNLSDFHVGGLLRILQDR